LFARLATLSFVTPATDGFLVLHNVVRATICNHLSKEKRRSSIDVLLAHYSESARVGSHFELNDAKIAALFEAAFLRRLDGGEGYVAWLAGVCKPLRIGAYYHILGSLWRDALSFAEPMLGSDHPDMASSYSNVASNLNAQGRLGEAEPLCRKALEINERVLGPDHPDTATSYNNVAYNLNAQGRLDEAEPLYRKALEINERALGPEHPMTIAARKNRSAMRRGS
jgi:tetratricopeptide (TPR) repeat protein